MVDLACGTPWTMGFCLRMITIHQDTTITAMMTMLQMHTVTTTQAG